MDIKIRADEMYPVYSVTPNDGHTVEATREQLVRWAEADEAFEKAQDEMRALYEPAAQAARERLAREKAEQEAAEKAAQKERQRAAQAELDARLRRREAAWERLTNSGGVVYDADGNPLGKLARPSNPWENPKFDATEDQ